MDLAHVFFIFTSHNMGRKRINGRDHRMHRSTRTGRKRLNHKIIDLRRSNRPQPSKPQSTPSTPLVYMYM